MTVRDILVFAFVFGSFPFCFTRPYYGLLIFSWLGYMRAQDLAWGVARYFRFSFYVAILMLFGWLFYERRPFMRRDGRCYLLMVLAAWVFLSILAKRVDGTIYYTAPVMKKYVEFFKVIVIALFTTGIVDSKKRLWILIGVIAASFGFYGVKGALWGALTGGRIIQGPGGMLKDNNDLCLALNMNIPFLYYLAWSVNNQRWRTGLLASVVMTIGTIVLTTSRGGFVTLAAVSFFIVMKSRKKLLGCSIGAVAGIIFLLALPADYVARLKTIKSPEQEASARARLDSWMTALKMVRANPAFGVGFNNFRPVFAFYDVNPEGGIKSVSRVAHNSYLQLWAESGTPALFFFLVTIAYSYYRMGKLRRWNYRVHGPIWVTNFTQMIQLSLTAFVVGGTFLNRAHFDFLYHLIAISVCLEVVAEREVAARKRGGPREVKRGEVKVTIADPFLVARPVG
ncbi:MAG: putative O-glycosylation ligase, exosortase A system-associated [Planctomycetota bacterium]